MAFVFSPSNMSTYMDCPRKFQAQSLTKEIKWKASTQKSRGMLVHNAVEKAMLKGLDAVTSWPEDMDLDYTKQRITVVRQLALQGAAVHIEKELIVRKDWSASTDWWDDNALLRAKADAIIVPTQVEHPVFLLDIKTGKKWDEMDFQLRTEALLAYYTYQRPVVHYAYWYVDHGDTVSGAIDFRNGFAPVQDVLDLMQEMNTAIQCNDFQPKKNKFCRWCGLYQTPGCGL